MIITENENYTFIKPGNLSLYDFRKEFKSISDNLFKNHLILDFSSYDHLDFKEISTYLHYAHLFNEAGFSFVIIANTLKYEDIIDKINVVPTLKEAEDILQMEAIERSLLSDEFMDDQE